MFEKPRIGQELLDVPMGDMIQQMAFAIAEAQMKLDANSIEVAEMMGGAQMDKTLDANGNEKFEMTDTRIFFGKEFVTVAEAKLRKADTGYPQAVKDEITTAIGAITDDKIIIAIPAKLSMLELGFAPTFYQFVDTIIEVKISVKYSQDGSQETSSSAGSSNKNVKHSGLKGLLYGGKKNKVVTTAQVNATYSQKYSYTAEGSSLLRTKLVPIPPPAILEDRIRQQMEIIKTLPAPAAS